MTRNVLVAVAAILLLSCSGDAARRPPADSGQRPVETARADSGLVSIEDTAGARVIPEEPATSPPARANRRARTPRAAAPEASAPPAPEPPIASDSAGATQPPPPVRAPDTVGTSRPVPARTPVRVPSTSAEPSRGTAVTIPVGTELHASLVDSIHSRHDSAGGTVTAKVMNNVTGPDGRTVIPAGAIVRLTVVKLEPAKSRSAADGELELRVDGIAQGERTLEVAAEVRPVPHELRGRGVTGSEAAKVGAGAAAGAIAGRVLGGDTRGAVIGGVVGAAGGAAVAAQTADRDIVVKAGTPITFVLTAPLVARRP